MTSTPGNVSVARRRLAQARRASGHTQETLADLLGVDRTTVARWDTGETEPQPHMRPRLAEALRVSLEELEALLADFTALAPTSQQQEASPKPPPQRRPISPLNAQVGARLKEEREARGWSRDKMARRLLQAIGIADRTTESLKRQILGWERGKHYPRDWASAYAKAFQIAETDLFGSMEPDPLVSGEEEDVKRRLLLESLGVLGAATVLQGDALATIRDAFNVSLAMGGNANTADEWQEIAHEYAHSYLVTPPKLLLPDLAGDIVAWQHAVNRGTDDSLPELFGAGATLALVMASTANSLGLTRESQHWWRSARHAADASQNRDVQVWVQGYEAMSGLYQGRPFRLVLDRAESAIRLGNGRVTPGLLEAMAGKAQVLAQLGAPTEAANVLQHMRDAFDALPDSLTAERASLLTWPVQRLLHTESFVYTTTGQTKEAAKAQAAAISAYPVSVPRERAQVELHRATSLVQDGHTRDGIAHAEHVLQTLPIEQHTRHVRIIAGKVLAAVPDLEAKQPSVNDFRERLAIASAAGGQQ